MSSLVQSFQCLQCSEFINTSMTQCKYCKAAVDPASAQAAAELQAQVNDACSDASYLRIVAGVYLVLLILIRLPIIAGTARIGSLAGFLLVPVLFVRWQLKYGQLQTKDPDYARARKTKNVALLIWAGLTVAALVVFGLLAAAGV